MVTALGRPLLRRGDRTTIRGRRRPRCARSVVDEPAPWRGAAAWTPTSAAGAGWSPAVPELARRPGGEPVAGRRLRDRRPHRGGPAVLFTGGRPRHRPLGPVRWARRCAGAGPARCLSRRSAQELPVGDVSVDAVVSGLVLNFVPDRSAALAEMRRVTPGRGDGRLRVGLRRRHAARAALRGRRRRLRPGRPSPRRASSAVPGRLRPT